MEWIEIKLDLAIFIHGISSNCLTLYSYHNTGHYPSSCPLFKTLLVRDWNMSPFSRVTYSVGPNR
jgi:hypothetical protein